MQQPVETQESQNTEIIDGLLVDSDTGEVIADTIQREGDYSVDELDRLLFRLNRMDAEAETFAKQHRTAQEIVTAKEEAALQALGENDPDYVAALATANRCEKLFEQLNARITFLKSAYEGPVKDLVDNVLQGQKSRTLKRPCGEVSLRSVPGKVEVVDVELAVAELEKSGHTDAIKKTVLVSKLSEAAIQSIEAAGEVPGMTWVEPSVSMKIKTAVSK
jgi:phage host-nuclease inhibitor protein Gam